MGGHLEGRTALVTGSVQGIGMGIAKSLAAAGARIAVHGLADEAQIAAAEAEVREAGAPDAKFFAGDLRKPDEIEALIQAVEAWGPLDILVNNAGVQKTVSLEDADTATWDMIIAVNLTAAFHTMHHALPLMAKRGYGRVVNIASVHGLVASKQKAPYVASKFGLVGMTKVAALEYAAIGNAQTGGVTINAICPGWTETALIEPQIQARAQQEGGGREEGVKALLSEKQPSLRMSDPSEMGDLAAFLCHRQAHNITGTAIPVDGGWTAQ